MSQKTQLTIKKVEKAKNEIGMRGVEFVEFSGDSGFYRDLLQNFGFLRSGDNQGLELYVQGEIRFLVNTQSNSYSTEFARTHGPSAAAIGLMFENAHMAFELAVKRGAKPYSGSNSHPLPAVYGIGGALVYFLDSTNRDSFYQKLFKVTQPKSDLKFGQHQGFGFMAVDHFTNNVPVGEMQKWCDFYSQVFEFQETRFFNIQGQQTGLISKVMSSPCGTFAIPINEPTDPKSQIQEYLNEYKGSGIQHLALTTPNIIQTMENLRSKGISFLASPPSAYYKGLKDRVPNVKEAIEKLEPLGILVDGDHGGYLLQIFTKNIIGPIFFEVIQRRGHEGFGEGNFQALFDSIEQDQRERGYL